MKLNFYGILQCDLMRNKERINLNFPIRLIVQLNGRRKWLFILKTVRFKTGSSLYGKLC